MASTSNDVLMDILAHDPDGGYTEPTEADYVAFGEWAVATYGQQAWDDYIGWTEQS